MEQFPGSDPMSLDPEFARSDISDFFSACSEVALKLNELGNLMQLTEQSFTTDTLLRSSNLHVDLDHLGTSALLRLHEHVTGVVGYAYGSGSGGYGVGEEVGGGGGGGGLLTVPVDPRVGEPPSPSSIGSGPLSPPPAEEFTCPCLKGSAQEIKSTPCNTRCKSIEELVRHMTKTHLNFFIWQCYGGKLWPELHRLKKHFCLKRKAQTRCYCTDAKCVDPKNDKDVEKVRSRGLKEISNKITPAQRGQGYRERKVVAKKRCVDPAILLRLMEEGKGEEELARAVMTKWEDVVVKFRFTGAGEEP